jgi:hypothetical protein
VEIYLRDGFRGWDKTRGLQMIVHKHLIENKHNILNNAFHWWKAKMIYAIYKYETSKGANLREVVKSTISVEHILPQKWTWIRDDDRYDIHQLSEVEWDEFSQKIYQSINGIGNLLLITPSENTTEGNDHPAEKSYNSKYGPNYGDHQANKHKWKDSQQWLNLIEDRGEKIYNFILTNLIEHRCMDSDIKQAIPPSETTQ